MRILSLRIHPPCSPLSSSLQSVVFITEPCVGINGAVDSIPSDVRGKLDVYIDGVAKQNIGQRREAATDPKLQGNGVFTGLYAIHPLTNEKVRIGGIHYTMYRFLYSVLIGDWY